MDTTSDCKLPAKTVWKKQIQLLDQMWLMDTTSDSNRPVDTAIDNGDSKFC